MAVSAAAIDALSKALYAGGAVIISAIFGAAARKIYNPRGSEPTDRLSVVEHRVDLLELRLNSMTSYRDRWRYLCLEARLMVEKFAAQAGLHLDPWPEDPEDPITQQTAGQMLDDESRGRGGT